MRINHNIAALNTYNKLGVNNNAMSKNMEKLSSGLRINRAGDDAAGLSISEKMRAQIRGLDQASKNAQDGISLLQTAEGGLNETHDILQRMNELATQAANGTLEPEDRQAISDELSQLTDEVDRIAKSANFNEKHLLDGSLSTKTDDANTDIKVSTSGVTGIDVSGAKAGTEFTVTTEAGKYTISGGGVSQTLSLTDGDGSGAVNGEEVPGTLDFDELGIKISFNGDQTATVFNDSKITTAKAGTNGTNQPISIQIGANTSADEKLGITIGNMTASGLGIDKIKVDTEDNARAAMDTIKKAVTTVSSERSKLGAYQNRLEHSINNLSTTSENLTASESRIRDVDMAKEMMEQTKNSILAQASQAMLTQANQQPQNVLQMLR